MESNGYSKRHLLAILQSEYVALKYEQTTRILIRENSIYINFVIVSAIASVAFSTPARLPLLLVVPFATSSVCWVYLNNDFMVTALRLFFTHEFPNRVMEALGGSTELERTEAVKIMGSWEVYHRTFPHRRVRKAANTAVVLLSFLGTTLASILVTAPESLRAGGLLLYVWMTDIALCLSLAVVLVLTKDW